MLACSANTFVHAQVVNDSLCMRPDSLHFSNDERLARLQNVKRKVKHAGGILFRFIKSFDDYDTTYISPNYYNFTVMAQNTNYFQTYRLDGTDQANHSQRISTKPASSIKVGPYFGWRWIFLGYTFDVSHPQAIGKSTEFSFSLYSSMLGCDFIKIKNDGNFRLRRTIGFDGVEANQFFNYPFTGLKASITSFSAYYVFNHRHFSYPAAYNQSTVQRKSCGSVMLGLGFSRQHLDFDYKQLPNSLIGTNNEEKIIEELKFSNIDYNYYYASVGYAYNWVFARNCLMGASVMPSLGVRKAKGSKLRGNELLLDLKNFSFDCTSRFGLVWNNAHWFVGGSFISHLYVYRQKRMSLTNSVNYANIYVGFFFNRKKIYK